MMIDATEVERYATEILALIDDHIKEGHVPASVASFSELHDYADANDFLMEVGVPWEAEEDGGIGNDYCNAVTSRVSQMLAARTV